MEGTREINATTLLFITNDDHSLVRWFEISSSLFNEELCNKILSKGLGFSEYHSSNDTEMTFLGANEIKELNKFINK
jgi:hypothetical protein